MSRTGCEFRAVCDMPTQTTGLIPFLFRCVGGHTQLTLSPCFFVDSW